MRKTRKPLSALLALLLVIQFVFATVSTSVFAETAKIVVVCADKYDADGEEVFTTLASAISYLGAEGGTVYIKGTVTLTSTTSFESGSEPRGEVVIRGYGNTASGGTLDYGSVFPSAAYLKGNVKFENLTIIEAGSVGFFSNSHKITFGEGLTFVSNPTAASPTIPIIANRENAGTNTVDIYSGTYKGIIGRYQHNATNVLAVNSNIRVFGGTIGTSDKDDYHGIYSGAAGAGGSIDGIGINGTFNAEIYGGTINRIYLGHNSGKNATMKGDARIDIYGGNISTVGFGNRIAIAGTPTMANSTLIVWGKGSGEYRLAKPVSIIKNTNFSEKTSGDKKFIAIINNAEEEMASFDASLTGDYCDYMLKVENGNAVPVFERTTANDPSTSTLIGFAITSDVEGAFPVVDGNKLVAGEDGFYDLSAYAEGKGEVKISFAKNLIPVVTTDESFVPGSAEKVFTTVSAAIDYLGQGGGKIYVKGDISFANGNSVPLNFEGTTEGRGEVIICGYGDTNAGGSISFADTEPGSAYIKGDITFENLTIHGTTSEYPIASIGHKMTFGKGLSTPGGKYLIGTRNDAGGHQSADIYSGTFGYVVPIFYNSAWGNKINLSSEYNLYGGTFDYVLLGVRNVVGENRIWQLNGDQVVNIYGGTVKNAYIGHQQHDAVLGDSFLNIYGGSLSTVGFIGLPNNESSTQLFGNAVITINSKGKDGSSFAKAIAIKQGDFAPSKTSGDKKFIAIINNSEDGVHSFDASLTKEYCDYMLKVENGRAIPVFERTTANDPSTSKLVGFRFEGDVESEYNFPVVDGIRLVPDENGIYDLSAYHNKGETTITVREFLTPVVTVDESFVPKKGEKVFETVASAIDYLGKGGGKIYIKGDISFENNNNTPLNFEGTTEGRDAVTICGYGDTNAGGSVNFSYTNPGTAYIKGDIIFENLTIYGTTSEYPFGAINHKITFGHGLSTPSGKYYLGARIDGSGHHSVDIYSGSFGYVVPFFYNYSGGSGSRNLSSEYNIYGGTVSNLFLGVRNATGTQVAWTLNGDSIANVYGGTISTAWVGHEYTGSVLGDSILNIYGGNISNAVFNNRYEKDTQDLGNAVISIYSQGAENSAAFTKGIAIKQGALAPARTEGTKKRIAIINNSENGLHSFDASLTAEYCDYMLKAKSGIAEPVFERKTASDPSSSTLIGFKLIPEYEGAVPSVNGVVLTPDENGIYDLSDYEKDGETVIEFIHYGEHWVKYGANGTGSSPEDPASSVAYVINNSVVNYKANEEVTVYILQDDGEALYNSSAYVTDDANYSAPAIGTKPTAHIAPYKTSSDTAIAEFDAKLVIKSYDDGDSEKNYLIYAQALGVPDNITLSGDTTFDNIILVSPKKNHQSIFTNGNDVYFTADCEISGIAAYYAENSDSPWNGSFTASEGANAVMSSDGSKVVFDHAWTASTAGRQITVGTAGATFNNDASVYINAGPVTTPVAVGGTTFEKNLNIISAGANNRLTFKIDENAKVNGALQYIYNNSSSNINFTDYIRNGIATLKNVNAAGGTWILRASYDDINEYGMYVDVTDTAGVFRCTKENGVLLAQNTETLEHIVSENGLLTLPEGQYDVYFAACNEGESYVNTRSFIVALEDCTVDLSAQDHRLFDGQMFLGWKNEKTGVSPAVQAQLEKGDILTAQYDTFTYGHGGDFYIYGVQMRLSEPTGVRYIVEQKASVLEKLGEDNIIESGTVVIPVDLTHGKDFWYGTPVYSNANLSLTTIPTNPLIKLGTPATVPAEKIYKRNSDGVLYTAVLIGIKEKNYSEFYSAMGYIRYYDANGVEQIMYSDYAQTSLYKVALQAYDDKDEAGYTETETALLENIINYVEVTEPALYYDTYIGDNFSKATKAVCAIDGADCTDPNHAIYKLSNGLNIREVNVDWDYDAEVADENVPVTIAQISDTHVNYNNARDINENEASITHAYSTSQFYAEARTARFIVPAMEYAMMLDKVVVTGDVLHSLADGSMQVADRLMFRKDTWVGKEARTDENGNPLRKVSATLGNHERYKHMIGYVPDDKPMADNYPELQEGFPNDIVYHSEVLTTDDGKNPVMLVMLDNQRERYDDEIIATKLAADLDKAREQNIPVFIFQHVGLYTGDATVSSYQSYDGNGSVPNLSHPGNPNSTELTKEVYTLLTDNADIVRGVFCGHEHVNCYTEIIGTGENGTGHVIPQNFLNTNQDDGGYVIKISVK